jgi:hypothetical protein
VKVIELFSIRQPGPQGSVGKGRRSGIARGRSQGILHKGKHRPLLNWLHNSFLN